MRHGPNRFQSRSIFPDECNTIEHWSGFRVCLRISVCCLLKVFSNQTHRYVNFMVLVEPQLLILQLTKFVNNRNSRMPRRCNIVSNNTIRQNTGNEILDSELIDHEKSKKGISRISKIRLHIEFALMMIKCQQYDRAEYHLQEALVLHPTCYPIKFILAEVLQKQKKYDGAEKLLLSVISSSLFCQKIFDLIRMAKNTGNTSECVLLEDPMVTLEEIQIQCEQILENLTTTNTSSARNCCDNKPTRSPNLLCRRSHRSSCCCSFCVGPLVNLAALKLVKFEPKAIRNHSRSFSFTVLRTLSSLGYDAPEIVMNLSLAMRIHQPNGRHEATKLVVDLIYENTKELEQQFAKKITYPIASLGISTDTKSFCLAKLFHESYRFDGLTVCCVKWGSYYSSDYVNQLFYSIQRHLHFPQCPEFISPSNLSQPLPNLQQCHSQCANNCKSKIRFICFTDNFRGLSISDGISAYPFTCSQHEDRDNTSTTNVNSNNYQTNTADNHSEQFFFDQYLASAALDPSNTAAVHSDNNELRRGWWSKTFLFSSYASSILFKSDSSFNSLNESTTSVYSTLYQSKGFHDWKSISLCLYLDLDVVVCGNVCQIVNDYLVECSKSGKSINGIMTTLSTNNIYCELAAHGVNTSVMLWTNPYQSVKKKTNKSLLSSTKSNPTDDSLNLLQIAQQAIYDNLTPLVRRYIHRFDFWIETLFETSTNDNDNMYSNLIFLDQSTSHPQRVYDYQTLCKSLHDKDASALSNPQDSRSRPPSSSVLIVFPRFPKPHQVQHLHPDWIPKIDQL